MFDFRAERVHFDGLSHCDCDGNGSTRPDVKFRRVGCRLKLCQVLAACTYIMHVYTYIYIYIYIYMHLF